MADVYAADVLADVVHGPDRDPLDGIYTAEGQVAALLALVPDAEGVVIDRDGRVWGLEQLGPTVRDYAGKLLYRKVPVTSEEE